MHTRADICYAVLVRCRGDCHVKEKRRELGSKDKPVRLSIAKISSRAQKQLDLFVLHFHSPYRRTRGSVDPGAHAQRLISPVFRLYLRGEKRKRKSV